MMMTACNKCMAKIQQAATALENGQCMATEPFKQATDDFNTKFNQLCTETAPDMQSLSGVSVIKGGFKPRSPDIAAKMSPSKAGKEASNPENLDKKNAAKIKRRAQRAEARMKVRLAEKANDVAAKADAQNAAKEAIANLSSNADAQMNWVKEQIAAGKLDSMEGAEAAAAEGGAAALATTTPAATTAAETTAAEETTTTSAAESTAATTTTGTGLTTAAAGEKSGEKGQETLQVPRGKLDKVIKKATSASMPTIEATGNEYLSDQVDNAETADVDSSGGEDGNDIDIFDEAESLSADPGGADDGETPELEPTESSN